MWIKTALHTTAGFFFLGLGAIGLFIPIWPTTPFIMLSAACFTCAPRIREKILRISFFREHIENYESGGGLSKKTVCISLSYLWGMLLLSTILMAKLWLTFLLLGIGIGVTIHILCMAKRKPRSAVDDQ